MARLEITYTKSAIGYRADQGHTIRSLGLRRLGQSTVQADTPSVRGMLHKVRHLVTVAELPDEAEEASSAATAATDGEEA